MSACYSIFLRVSARYDNAVTETHNYVIVTTLSILHRNNRIFSARANVLSFNRFELRPTAPSR
jgi:hypothetical protein